jgi:hypothetical protein
LAKDPDYLIIGAQKCGTTTLFNYLSNHPQVSNPAKKELHYFDLNFEKPFSWYQSFFEGSSDQVSGEATPFYLYGYNIPQRIYQKIPTVKIIVLLRNPIDRAYSHFHMQKDRKIEPFHSFSKAIQREEERLSLSDPFSLSKHSSYIHHSYLDRGNYYAQLLRWSVYFDISSFLYIFSEELFSSPKSVYQAVCSYLNIDLILNIEYEHFFKQQYPNMNPRTRRFLSEHFNLKNQKLFSLINKSYDWK